MSMGFPCAAISVFQQPKQQAADAAPGPAAAIRDSAVRYLCLTLTALERAQHLLAGETEALSRAWHTGRWPDSARLSR